MVRSENRTSKFLGNVGQSTPVYCMSEDQYEVIPAVDFLNCLDYHGDLQIPIPEQTDGSS